MVDLSFLQLANFAPDTAGRTASQYAIGHKGEVTSLVASHDSRWIVTASNDDTIVTWDTSTGAVLHEWLANQHGVNALALSSDSQQLVSAGHHTTLALWEMDSDIQRVATLEGHTDSVVACVWSPDGALVASASKDQTVRIWDGHTFHHKDLFSDPEEPQALQFSPDSRHLAWISGNNCRVWKPLMGEEPQTLPLHPGRCGVFTFALSFDPESRRIATAHGSIDCYGRSSGSDACGVRVWDLVAGATLAILVGHSQRVNDIAFSPDGRSLLTVSKKRSARIWDAKSGKKRLFKLFKDMDHKRVMTHALFSPDGKYIATGSDGGRVVLWRVGDRSRVATIHPESGDDHWVQVRKIAFTPSGEYLASGDSKGIVQIHPLSKFKPRSN